MNDRGGKSKVFGLGLSRTGTTSLAKALNALGIRTVHYPYDEQTYSELTSGRYELTILRKYEAVVDISVAPFYPQLDKVYPGANFILTIRQEEEWLASIEAHWIRMLHYCEDNPQFKRFTEFICTRVYDSLRFNEERFRHVYETHCRSVHEYSVPTCESGTGGQGLDEGT